MSTAISNAGPPLEYQSIPERIDGATVNIPLDSLKELYPDIQRFTAMALKFSYHPGSPSEPRVLLIERNGKNSSWGNTWEPGGGTPDKEDPTIIHSAARESGRRRKSGLKDLLKMLSLLMRTLAFIIIDNEKTMAQRVWSSEMQQPVGQSSVEISDEHLDHCWFTEDEVRSAALYVKGTPPGPFAMLLAKKDMVLLAFELFRQSQGQNVPPSFDIVR
ncbi:hypothetical protein N7530_008907 [Penicillium desertorum]|uniref:Nudix hydrolase domain-containing protein n=1 Tax=Penicillium desertorum TaxID=1303715 RepID=A0A9W9WPY6_9EURO|nr:hypothetical protein N7530_008907 [Penicillium desertorum]